MIIGLLYLAEGILAGSIGARVYLFLPLLPPLGPLGMGLADILARAEPDGTKNITFGKLTGPFVV